MRPLMTEGGMVVALFQIEAADIDGIYRIRLQGEFDLAAFPQAERALADAIKTHQQIEVDLRELTFIDSSGVRALTVAWNRSRTMVRSFWIVPGPPAVQRVFDITGLTDVLPFASPASHSDDEPTASSTAQTD